MTVLATLFAVSACQPVQAKEFRVNVRVVSDTSGQLNLELNNGGRRPRLIKVGRVTLANGFAKTETVVVDLNPDNPLKLRIYAGRKVIDISLDPAAMKTLEWESKQHQIQIGRHTLQCQIEIAQKRQLRVSQELSRQLESCLLYTSPSPRDS